MSSLRYDKLTFALALGLCAPHTWIAAISPVMIAVCACFSVFQVFEPVLTLVLLAICIMLQSSVNVLNDYFDFKSGLDSRDDVLEASDAVLLHNDLDPRQVLALAIGLIVASFSLGIYVIYLAGWIPLVIGVIGAIVIVLYSGTRTPISYLPIGEFVSGFVMGVLMLIACTISLLRTFEPVCILWSLPVFFGIALIMFTNNLSDIEKDRAAGRHTLPVLLGRGRATMLYRALLLVWQAVGLVVSCLCFYPGVIISALLFFAMGLPLLIRQLRSSIDQDSRIRSMSGICDLNTVLCFIYAVGILFCR